MIEAQKFDAAGCGELVALLREILDVQRAILAEIRDRDSGRRLGADDAA